MKHQTVVRKMREHRFHVEFSEPKLNTFNEYTEATSFVFTTFADSDANGLYATVSVGGRFVKDFKLGFDGFRRPGVA